MQRNCKSGIDREQTVFKSSNDPTIKYYIRCLEADIKGYITIDEIGVGYIDEEEDDF